MAAKQLPLTIILGPTASGKEAAAFALAQKIGGEIVSVDSMKIYRQLDIGTAKADAAKRAAVTHHCLDIVDPTQEFSVAQYQQAADQAIADIAARGKPVLLSGGTALYYKALLEGLFEAPEKDETLRKELYAFAEQEGNAALYARLVAADSIAAAKLHANDIRRVVRALEIITLTGEPISARQQEWSGFHGEGHAFAGELRYPVRIFKLERERPELWQRIEARIERMVQAGIGDEARFVYDNRDQFTRTPLQAVGYKEFFPYFAGEATFAQAVERLTINTRQLAKSQTTWFRKFPGETIALTPDSTAESIAQEILQLEAMSFLTSR